MMANSQRFILSIIIAAVLALFLVGNITRFSFVAFLARTNPSLALSINAAYAPALLERAKGETAKVLPAIQAEGFAVLPKDLDIVAPAPERAQDIAPAVFASAYAALRADPLSAQAFELLGRIAAVSGDAASADKYMAAATARSVRAPAALYWMFRDRYSHGEFSQALRYGDALLRLNPQSMAFVAPILGRIAEHPGGAEPLAHLLSQSPPWRRMFFENLKGNIADARTPMSVLFELKNSLAPPTPEEMRAYIALLSANNLHEMAYNAWLQFLPVEQLRKAGFLYNGAFDEEVSGYPFDWSASKDPGLFAERMYTGENKTPWAYHFEFTGERTGSDLLWQTLVLQPGSYTLKALHHGQIRARRGVKWTVRCLEANQLVLGETPTLNGQAQKHPLEMTFDVPAENCKAQKLALVIEARSPSDTMLRGDLNVAQVSIGRAATVLKRDTGAMDSGTLEPVGEKATGRIEPEFAR